MQNNGQMQPDPNVLAMVAALQRQRNTHADGEATLEVLLTLANARIKDQDAQLAAAKKQIADLEAQIAEKKAAPARRTSKRASHTASARMA